MLYGYLLIDSYYNNIIFIFTLQSNEPPETVSTSSFALKIPRRNCGFSGANFKFQNPMLMGEEMAGFPKSPFPVDGMLGGFPIRLLDMIVSVILYFIRNGVDMLCSYTHENICLLHCLLSIANYEL